MKKLIIGLAMASVSLTSNAEINYSLGEWGSGGGNAIVCFQQGSISQGNSSLNIISEIKKNNNKIEDRFLNYIDSIEMYDLYDAKKKRGISSKSPKIINIEKDEEIYSYLDRVGSRFSNSVNLLKGIIKYGKELLPEDNIAWEETAVQHQNDLGTVSLPGNNCVIATMAAQVNHNDYYMVYIDSRLFNHPKHSKQSKATLILHELIYSVMREKLKHTDSGSTRNIVRYLISSHSSYTEGKIAEVLSRLGLSSMTGIDNLSEVSKKFFWSEIMQQLRLELDSFQYYVNRYFESSYTSNVNEELNRRITALVEKEDLLDLANYPKNLLGEYQIIKDSLSRSNLTQEWNSIYREFVTIYNDLFADIERQIAYSKQDVLDNIDSYTNITTGDRSLVVGKLDSYFEDYTMYKFPTVDFFEYVYERNNEGLLVNSIFDHFLVYEQCSASFPGSGQDVSTDTKNKACYGTLKLDYIIPSKAK